MLIIDRFESDWAIIETEKRQTFNLPRSLLPLGIKEGDVITIQVDINVAATKERADQSKRMLENFFNE